MMAVNIWVDRPMSPPTMTPTRAESIHKSFAEDELLDVCRIHGGRIVASVQSWSRPPNAPASQDVPWTTREIEARAPRPPRPAQPTAEECVGCRCYDAPLIWGASLGCR